MQLNRQLNIKNLLLGLLGSLLLNQAIAATPATAPIVEGTDYTVITTPVPKTPEPKGHVNVKEFFSFSCIHCKDIEPLVATTLLPDKKVDLNRIHIVWNPPTPGYAKLNATIQILKLDKLYTPTFNAIFAQQDLNDPAQLKSFLLKNGLSQDQTNKFMSTYDSFTVNSKVSEYKTMMDTYNITGTPTFIVADKYVAKPALPDRLIQVVQQLVAKAAAEKK
jgi:thiol:disulfide interchange protein DsbA